jgi:hypothetical protein
MSATTKSRLSIRARALSAHELRRAERVAFDADRRPRVAADGLLRLLLAHDTGTAPLTLETASAYIEATVVDGLPDLLRSGLRAPGAALEFRI